MKKILSLMLIAGMAVTVLWAQTKRAHPKRWRPMVLNNGKPSTVVSAHDPVTVNGEGAATPSGVRYWDIRAGTGDTALRGHTVKVLYMAWVENGKEFAASASHEKPTVFTLGAGQVIPGLEDGVEGMKVGSKRQLKIPPALAYGDRGMPPGVPPNAALIFDVELVAVD
jgi:FKBP-type peptidyl-prolyl cis-trans isomerase